MVSLRQIFVPLSNRGFFVVEKPWMDKGWVTVTLGGVFAVDLYGAGDFLVAVVVVAVDFLVAAVVDAVFDALDVLPAVATSDLDVGLAVATADFARAEDFVSVDCRFDPAPDREVLLAARLRPLGAMVGCRKGY